MPKHPRPRRRAVRPQGPVRDATPQGEVEVQPAGGGGIYGWHPPAVVKVTTQMTVEHRRLMSQLEAQTGRHMWELLHDALENAYGPTDSWKVTDRGEGR